MISPKGNVFVSVRDDDKKDILKIISILVENNFKIFATLVQLIFYWKIRLP